MVKFPAVNQLPETGSEAVAVPLEPKRVAAPSNVLPSVKETDPVGEALPPLAVTVAVSVELPPTVMPAGLAVTVVVVATAGTVMVTVTDPDDAPKPVFPP
jgi:hypothetical protein